MTQPNDTIDDVPMLGGIFASDDDDTSSANVVADSDDDAPASDDATNETPATVTLPKKAPSIAAARKAAKTSPNFGGTPPAAGGAAMSPTSVPVTPEDLEDDEAPAAPEWQKPLTPEELGLLFDSSKPLVMAAPRLNVSGLRSATGRYSVSTPGPEVSESARDSEIGALQSSGTLPTSVNKIDNFSARIRHNTELLRMSTEDRKAMSLLGFTDGARYGDDSLTALPWTRVESTDLLRYAWSAYSGKLFGSEEVVLGPDGKPVVSLEGHDAPLSRPNGELYYPRKVRTAGTDEPLYDTRLVADAAAARIPVLLYGPPGTGKTSLCEAVLPNLVTISGTADTETADFVGGYVQNPDGTFEWVDGPLIVAMENGFPLLIDEIALIDSRVLALVYSVMDGREEVHITANPKRGTVRAAEGFYVIGACNPDVPGAVMSDALLSRFSLQMEVTTDYDMLRTLGVDRDIITAAKNLSKAQALGRVQKAPQTREMLAYTRIKSTFGQTVALANLVSSALPTDRDAYKDALHQKFAGTVESLAT